MALQLNNVQVIYEIIVYQIDQMSDFRLLVASGFISVQYIEYLSSKRCKYTCFCQLNMYLVYLANTIYF